MGGCRIINDKKVCSSPRALWAPSSNLSSPLAWVSTSPLADVDFAILEVTAQGSFTISNTIGATMDGILVNGVQIMD